MQLSTLSCSSGARRHTYQLVLLPLLSQAPRPKHAFNKYLFCLFNFVLLFYRKKQQENLPFSTLHVTHIGAALIPACRLTLQGMHMKERALCYFVFDKKSCARVSNDVPLLPSQIAMIHQYSLHVKTPHVAISPTHKFIT